MTERETFTFEVSGGIKVAADAMGQKEAQPVLLLHGGGQTRGSWRETIDALAGLGYRAYALDLRGHGETSRSPNGDYSPDAFVDDLVEVIRQTGGGAMIIGASLGGIIGLLTGGEYGPSVVKALVMVDVAARTNHYGVSRIQGFMRAHSNGFASVEEAADAVAAFASDRPRPKNIKGLERNLRKIGDRYFWHWDPRFMESWHPAHRAAAGRLERAARALTIPVLLVHAAHSDVLGKNEIEHLESLIPHLEYARVEQASHMVVGDQNSDFNRAILKFLADHGPPAKG
ncbi:Pimeloyl-ACP methyl ester carboxylesterase [Rhizobiales bacterium GAS191]|nr:Pimeloyl-ACP methyl ester carboxylesterase [Rhizobiales bacterium GAS113]SEF15467.1 Pimeloyl-ACP methyl ester carboxylesterase [Rhizobiales bacterium GAS191]